MEIPDRLRCLFSAEVEEQDGRYVVEIPDQEFELGELHDGGTYRVAVLPQAETGQTGDETTDANREQDQNQGPPDPPVEEGEQRDVEIESIGDQGDGIARVERGFVVIVPDTDQGERVTVEISEVRENVAFAEVVDRRDQFQ